MVRWADIGLLLLLLSMIIFCCGLYVKAKGLTICIYIYSLRMHGKNGMKSCATVYSFLLLQLTSTLTNEEERKKPRDKIKPGKKRKPAKTQEEHCKYYYLYRSNIIPIYTNCHTKTVGVKTIRSHSLLLCCIVSSHRFSQSRIPPLRR